MPQADTGQTAANISELANIDQISSAIDSLSAGQSGWIALAITVGIRILTALSILTLGWVLGNFIDRRFEASKRLDKTLANFLGGFLKYIMMVVALVTVIGLFGIPMASLLAVMGAAGLAIGLALQGTLSNVASGVMILLLRPFNIGDYITFGSEGGTVKSLGLFGTELAMPDNVYVFAPNSQIWGNQIRNYSRNLLRRQDINVGISYSDNINKAFSVIMDVMNNDPRIIQDQDEKNPQVMMDTMGDFSLNLIARFWSANTDYWSLHWDVTKAIKEALDNNGITIPFPTRTVEMIDSSGTDVPPEAKKKIVSSSA